jgi:hypothetical protein
MISTADEELAEHLRALAAGLTKCGIPVQLRTDSDRRPYVRASHPEMPLSTDVYCMKDESGSWSFHSEWGSAIALAEDLVSAIGYIVKLLRIPAQ